MQVLLEKNSKKIQQFERIARSTRNEVALVCRARDFARILISLSFSFSSNTSFFIHSA